MSKKNIMTAKQKEQNRVLKMANTAKRKAAKAAKHMAAHPNDLGKPRANKVAKVAHNPAHYGRGHFQHENYCPCSSSKVLKKKFAQGFKSL